MTIIVLGLTQVSYAENNFFTDNDLITDQYIVVLKDDNASSQFMSLDKIHEYEYAMTGFVIKSSPSEIEKLRNSDNVLFIQQDRMLTSFGQILPSGIDRVDADLNRVSQIDGIDQRVNANVAILDGGLDIDNLDLNIVGGINFISDDPDDFNDVGGHGTHVAGIVAALDNDIGVVGVAPGANLWAVKVMNENGSGSISDIIKGIDWVTANSDIIDVVNMSMGGHGTDDNNCGLDNNDAMHYAICNSVAKGVVYVVAAGNDAKDAASVVPASYDEVITVSSMADFDGKPGALALGCLYDLDDTFSLFSNFGEDVDFAAPGICIDSTSLSNGVVMRHGTSTAAPHVTGAVALYISENGKPVDEAGTIDVKLALLQLATPQNGPNGFNGDPDNFPEPIVNVERTVIDGIPIITLIGANPQKVELNAGYIELGATIDVNAPIIIDSTAFRDIIGDYVIFYDSLVMLGNDAIQVIRTVNVVNEIAPIITLIGANPQLIKLGDGYTELGSTTDEGSPITIDSTEFIDELGSYSIYYYSTDNADNVATLVSRTVNVLDTSIPVITSLIADDPDDLDDILSTDDTITITFDSDTNMPGGIGIQRQNAINDMFTFSEFIGGSFRGNWVSADTFVITIKSARNADLIIGTTTVTPTGVIPIRSYDGVSLASFETSPVLDGDFGDLNLEPIIPVPRIISIVADDPNDLDDTYSRDDTITITFDSETNMPGGTNLQRKPIINDMFTFSEELGRSYVGKWVSPDTFTITIKSVNNAGPPVIGLTTITPTGITLILSADQTSLASTDTSPVLSGDFGIIS